MSASKICYVWWGVGLKVQLLVSGFMIKCLPSRDDQSF